MKYFGSQHGRRFGLPPLRCRINSPNGTPAGSNILSHTLT